MSPPWHIRIYEKQRLLFSTELSGPVELGRQSDGEKGLFAIQTDAGRSRLVIARVEEQGISRKHVLLTPLPDGRARIDNLSNALPILLSDGTELKPGAHCDASLPVVLSLDRKAVRVEAAEAQEEANLTLRTLAAAPVPPESGSSIPARFPSLEGGLAGGESKELLSWLQATMSVFLSAASSSDFFTTAARAMVDVVGLDSGRVLILTNDTWQPQAVHTVARLDSDVNWLASRSILNRVREEKRTFWGMPPASASLQDIRAVVAAPILDRAGNLVGVLYGDRRQESNPVATGGSPVARSTTGEPPVVTGTITELQARLVELLASGVAAGLARLKQEQAAMEARVQFEQFFTPELAQQLALDPNLLQGRDAEASLLFCDIRGFSRVSERLGPERTVAWIADVMETLSQCVLAEHGVLVDYIGDELLAMWGAPQPEPDHPRLACRAALAMVASLPALNQRWEAILGQPMSLGIGINTGVARVGNTGSKRKFKYGPLGNTVNLASRVQGATKYLKSLLLITGATKARLDDSFALRRLCKVRVVNIQEPVDLYEVVPLDHPAWPKAREEYEAALEQFEQGNFRQAARTLGSWRMLQPDDGPALLLLHRAVSYMIEEPVSFDPVWVLPGK